VSRAQPLQPEDRRALLLLAARRTFARLGYHKTGVADIVDAAGVARGTFYNYFESKRNIFAAVLEGVMDEINQGVRPIDVSTPIPPQVREMLKGLVRVAMAPDVCRLMFTEAVGLDAEGDQAVQFFYDAALNRLEKALYDGQALGIVRNGDVPLMAQCLLGLVKEPVFQAVLHGVQVDAEKLTDELFALTGTGVLAV
jgi:AcrR family transcriptional regulator